VDSTSVNSQLFVVVSLFAVGACGQTDNGGASVENGPTTPSREFYESDPAHYWAQYGLPPLVRQSRDLEEAGLDPESLFDTVAEAFDEGSFAAAVESGSLPSPEAEPTANGAAFGVWRALVEQTVAVLDELRAANVDEGQQAEAFGQLRVLVDEGLNPAILASVGPNPNKGESETTPILPATWCGFDPAATEPRPGDADPTTKWPWRKITPDLWDTTYDAACVGVATGACAAKLGLPGFGPEASCEQWNDLSKRLGATPGEDAGSVPEMWPFFAGHGYCGEYAFDGPRESACEQAQKATQRGCDVFLLYFDPNSPIGHMEMVDLINLDPADDTSCTVHTLSWGESHSVQYDGSFLDTDGGRFSKKEDGNRYPAGSNLRTTGTAKFLMFCPCKQ